MYYNIINIIIIHGFVNKHIVRYDVQTINRVRTFNNFDVRTYDAHANFHIQNITYYNYHT